MATRSSILAWKIPWVEEPGRLQSLGSQSRAQLSDFTHLFLYRLMFTAPIANIFYWLNCYVLSGFLTFHCIWALVTKDIILSFLEFLIIFLSAAAAKSLQSCPTLYNPIDGSPPGSPIPGILQARILGRVAISFSRRSSWPRDWTRTSYVSCICGWVLYY